MRERCDACGLTFNREPGYFLGAMYISYGLGSITILAIGLVLWILTRWPVLKAGFWAMLLFLPFAPAVTYLSRVLWIYLDQAIDPEPHAGTEFR